MIVGDCTCNLRKFMAPQNSDKELIVKRTLFAGTQAVPFKNGTKIHFHFQSRRCNDNKLLDDSRKMGQGKPLELILGKKFKLDVWEVILQKMALNEVAEFTVDKSLVVQYPFVSKTIRDIHKPSTERKSHCCAMTLHNEGVGYDDLNELWKNPSDLQFIMEVIKVEQPEEYEKETWQMEEEEKIDLVPKLKEQGNLEYKNKNYAKAAELYGKAVAILEQLMLKEKPHDEEWNELEKQKNPILLNFSQCKLQEGDYYAVIEHCTTVIQSDKECVKAYYKRAKAHSKVWNFEEARRDFHKVMELDESQTNLVKKDLTELEKVVKTKDSEDKLKFSKLFV